MKLILKLGLLAAVADDVRGPIGSGARSRQSRRCPRAAASAARSSASSRRRPVSWVSTRRAPRADPLAIAKCKDKFQVSPVDRQGLLREARCQERDLALRHARRCGRDGSQDRRARRRPRRELYPTSAWQQVRVREDRLRPQVQQLRPRPVQQGARRRAGRSTAPSSRSAPTGSRPASASSRPSTATPRPPWGTSTAPPCLTFTDINALRNKDDAFIDDVVAELAAGKDQNNQRCTNDTSVHCATAPGGGGCGGGTCEFWFGSPLSLAAGGVTTCVTNQWAGGISGTFDQQGGASAGTASVLARVYNGILVANPCPRCIGDNFPADGAKGGTCSGGAAQRPDL